MQRIQKSVKNTVNILYAVLWTIFTHTNSTTWYKQSVFKYLLNTTLGTGPSYCYDMVDYAVNC